MAITVHRGGQEASRGTETLGVVRGNSDKSTLAANGRATGLVAMVIGERVPAPAHRETMIDRAPGSKDIDAISCGNT